jgi:hypothetical protein
LAAEYPGFGHVAGRDDQDTFSRNWPGPIASAPLRQHSDSLGKIWEEAWSQLRDKYGTIVVLSDDSDSLFRYRGFRWWGKFYNTDSRDPRLDLKALADEAVLEFDPQGLKGRPPYPFADPEDNWAICKGGYDIVLRWLEILYHVLEPPPSYRTFRAQQPICTELPCGVFTASAIVVEKLAEPAADAGIAFNVPGIRQPALTRRQLKALNFIKQKPGCKAITIAMHLGISVGRFYSGYSPALKSHGVRVAHDGYFPPDAPA